MGDSLAPDMVRRMAWKTKPRRSRPLTRPEGFVAPCVPVVTARPPTGAEWLHELKYDGYRICARCDGTSVHLWSRHTTDYAGSMTRIVAGLRKLRAKSFTIDGEAVVFRPDGRCDFFALRGNDGQADAVLAAFDLLELNGQDLHTVPIEDRRAMLAHLLRALPDGLIFSEAIIGHGPEVFQHACRLGVEGIVSKRVGSLYRSGRGLAWRKTLCEGYKRE
jgi:bifunctional non-homologous end joining protein LigD